MTTPAGWYDDPQNPQQSRFFDGQQWTEQTAPRQGAAPAAGQGWQQPTQPAAQPTGQADAWGQGGQASQPWQGQADQFQNPQQQYGAGMTNGAGYGTGQPPLWTSPQKSSKAPLFIALGVVVALVIGGGIFWVTTSKDDEPTATQTTTSKKDEKKEEKPTPSEDPSEDPTAEPSDEPSDDPTSDPSDDPGDGTVLTYSDLGVWEGYSCIDLADEYIGMSVDDPVADRLDSATDLSEVENNFGTVTQPTSGENVILSCKGTGVWGDGMTTSLRLKMTIDSDGEVYLFARGF